LKARVTLARQQAANDRQRLDSAGARLLRAWETTISLRKDRLTRLARLQESLSHKSVLARGFALVRDERDELVRGVAGAPAGAALTIEFADGRVAARAGAAEPDPTSSSRRRSRDKTKGGGQGSLF
jgi:exodeoxyribonuclease VII large subunit